MPTRYQQLNSDISAFWFAQVQKILLSTSKCFLNKRFLIQNTVDRTDMSRSHEAQYVIPYLELYILFFFLCGCLFEGWIGHSWQESSSYECQIQKTDESVSYTLQIMHARWSYMHICIWPKLQLSKIRLREIILKFKNCFAERKQFKQQSWRTKKSLLVGKEHIENEILYVSLHELKFVFNIHFEMCLSDAWLILLQCSNLSHCPVIACHCKIWLSVEKISLFCVECNTKSLPSHCLFCIW